MASKLDKFDDWENKVDSHLSWLSVDDAGFISGIVITKYGVVDCKSWPKLTWMKVSFNGFVYSRRWRTKLGKRTIITQAKKFAKEMYNKSISDDVSRGHCACGNIISPKDKCEGCAGLV